MDRVIIYPGQVPLETDLLQTNKFAMIALSKLAAAVLGTSTLVNGLAVVPTGPASLSVNVNAGEIYSLQNVDGTAYSSIAVDTHSIMKQGISLDAKNLACAAPGAVGQSINYLVQAAYADTDSGSVILPYYNASNPAVAYSGPNGSGAAQNTLRQGLVTVNAKAGVAATTGSQTTPAPDAGFVGLYVVTVANGQTTINSGNITVFAGAPIIAETLTQKISQATADARYALLSSVPPVPRGYISGLTMSTAGASTTMSIAPGQATDSTNAASLALASAINKTTAAWAVGSGNGGLDTGSATAGAWYHFFLNKRPDTGVVDMLFSTSATAPTLPANYTLFRRIGSGRLNGSNQWIAFIQDGDDFTWLAPVGDVTVVNPTTSAVLRTLSVPLGIRVLANLMTCNTSTSSNSAFYFSDPSTTDIAPSNGVGQVASPSTTTYSQSAIQVRTNTSSQIRSRASFSDGATAMYVTTIGWRDNRGKD